jgi:beta-lactam-binding protein with PASTA domain|nr:PASTA domain-containing protein [Bacteroidales bacterium]
MSKLSVLKDTSKIWFHILLALLITIVIGIISVIFLSIYTRHGEEVEMPLFVGQNAELLLQNTQDNDFIIVVSDYVFDRNTQEGTVLKQNPQAKELVKKGRKVYLTVASSEPPKLKMPDLKDVSLRQAEIMIKTLGLELANVIYKPSPFENVVLEQLYQGRAVAAGADIKVGDKITLVVGRSSGYTSLEEEELLDESEVD